MTREDATKLVIQCARVLTVEDYDGDRVRDLKRLRKALAEYDKAAASPPSEAPPLDGFLRDLHALLKLPNLGAMYQDMAKGLGGRLVCAACGKERTCSERDAAGYLARGWPKCCGLTMWLESARAGARSGRTT